jgi:Mce-associated membrane protein
VAEQSVKNYGVDRTCAVFATGVEQIDTDSAQVLVAGSFSETLKNKSGKRISAGEPAPFRLRVSLDKIDGRWLVDDYQTVTS